MKVLVVEDTAEKRKKLVGYVGAQFPEAVIDQAESYNGGVNRVLAGDYDLVLLDMSMPTFDSDKGECSGRMRALAGRDIISKMVRRGIVCPVVVVTRFDVFGAHDKKITLPELDAQLKKSFPRVYVGAVFFENSSTSWLTDLDKSLRGIGLIDD